MAFTQILWVTNSNICAACGAEVASRNRTQHENFHKTFSNRIGDDMSRVSWCDYGDHAFKRGVEGSASFNGTEYDGDGRAVDTQMDACPDHNPLNVQRAAAKYAIAPDVYRNVTDSNPAVHLGEQ